MTLWEGAILALAGFIAGALNAVAGGGTFITFGALVALGMPPISANATSALAMWPGMVAASLAYAPTIRAHFRGWVPLTAISLIGGLGGGLLLLQLDNQQFRAVVPWLMLLATALFATAPLIGKLAAVLRPRTDRPASPWPMRAAHAVISFYGGFFNAGMGIMMHAAMRLLLSSDFHHNNAAKNLFATIIPGAAVAAFILAGLIAWPQALLLTVAGTAGGWSGVRLARMVPSEALRWFVVAVGATLTVIYFLE